MKISWSDSNVKTVLFPVLVGDQLRSWHSSENAPVGIVRPSYRILVRLILVTHLLKISPDRTTAPSIDDVDSLALGRRPVQNADLGPEQPFNTQICRAINGANHQHPALCVPRLGVRRFIAGSPRRYRPRPIVVEVTVVVVDRRCQNRLGEAR